MNKNVITSVLIGWHLLDFMSYMTLTGDFLTWALVFCLFAFVVLGLELKAYTFSHYISPFLCWVFTR
jgi:hypothetical protein